MTDSFLEPVVMQPWTLADLIYVDLLGFREGRIPHRAYYYKYKEGLICRIMEIPQSQRSECDPADPVFNEMHPEYIKPLLKLEDQELQDLLDFCIEYRTVCPQPVPQHRLMIKRF